MGVAQSRGLTKPPLRRCYFVFAFYWDTQHAPLQKRETTMNYANYTHLVIAERDNTPYNLNTILLAAIITLTAQYGGSFPDGHSRKRTALLTATFTLQEPVFLNSHTNTVFLQSLEWPAPATDTFFASRGCLLTRVPLSRGVIFTRARESDVESTHQPEIINQS